MYKAIQSETGEEIIILRPQWRERIEFLRELDQANKLECQGCRQPLRVKAGAQRRAHFAHKHLKACSYGRESPALLSARAVIFEWLQSQFGELATVEKTLDGVNLPRPIDCWVDTPRGPFAYWIVETSIKLDPRIIIKESMARLGGNGHFIFLASMIHEEKKRFHSLLLTPTERAFLTTTPYDTLISGLRDPGGSLHYLDPEEQRLTTYRNLVLHHQPNWFAGHKKSALLADLRVNRADGQIVYPGENEKLSEIFQKRERLERKREQFTAKYGQAYGAPAPAPRALRGWGLNAQAAGKLETLQCIICGRMTDDYWSTFYDEQGQKYCRCRDCLDQGRVEP